MKRTSAVVLTGVLALGGIAMAACSSSDSSSSPEASSSQIVGDNPGTWSPLEISQSANGTTIDMVVDQAGYFIDFPEGGAVVESSDPAVVEVSQPRTEGDAVYRAGIVAKAPGSATITVLYPDEPADEGGASNIVMQFDVTVAQ